MTPDMFDLSTKAVLETSYIRNGFGGAFLGDGLEADPDDVRAENLAKFDKWLAAERAKAFAASANWARSRSGESADAAADYIEEMAAIVARVAQS